MYVTPRYVSVAVVVMTRSLLGCARLGAGVVGRVKTRSEVEEAHAFGTRPECVDRATLDVHRATRSHDLAPGVELALHHEDDLVLVVRVRVERGVGVRAHLEH